MADIKKFMFDNFVISNEPKPVHKTEELPAEEVFIPEEEIIVPEEVIIEQTYTKDELEKAVNEAEEEGYQRGLASLEEGLAAETAVALASIDNSLKELFSEQNSVEKELEKEFFAMAKALVNRLLPNLIENSAADIVENFIKDNFSSFKKEAKLSFYLHPDIISSVQDIISKSAHLNDFEGKISLHKDAGLERSGCKVEWESGGVELAPNTMINKMNDLLDKTSGESNE